MGDVEGAGWTWNGDVNHHVALLQYFLADAVTFVAYDEGGVSRKFCLVDVRGIRCGLDCDDFFICWYEFAEIGFLGEIPLYVVFARSSAFPYSPDAIRRLGAEKYHLRGPDVIGQAYHRTHVIGRKKAIGNDDGPRNGIVERFGARFFK